MNEITAYKINYRKLIYITNNEHNETHYVPNRAWDIYIRNRKTIPHLCIICNSVKEAITRATIIGEL
ncbi:MAG: hypothetical protein P8Y70_00285 [Candidatus Lokiarchaeota archaeon]